MDSLENLRLKARARLASLFAQSVAEGHSAYDSACVRRRCLVRLGGFGFGLLAVEEALSWKEITRTPFESLRRAKAPTVSARPGLVQKAPPPPLPSDPAAGPDELQAGPARRWGRSPRRHRRRRSPR